MRSISLLLFLSLMVVSDLRAQQLDYLKMAEKEPLLSVCLAEDSSAVEALCIRLESFPVDSIGLNRHLYHYELGMAYYKLSAYRNDSAYMRKAAIQMQLALKSDPYHWPALWSAALMHMFLNECTPALYYIKLYQKLCPKKLYDKSGMKWIQKRCSP